MGEEPKSGYKVVEGPLKVVGGCPAPDLIIVPVGEGQGEGQVCISNITAALDDMSKWIHDIRRVIECLPEDACIECDEHRRKGKGRLVVPGKGKNT